MRVLITNTSFARHTGSELYVRDLACELKRRGHDPVIYSPQIGPLAETLRLEGISVVDDLRLIRQAPDLIHGQHHLETMAALGHFPGVPAVYCCHGWVPWEELPPRHPRILHYLCVSATLHERLTRLHRVPESRVHRVLNFVDLLRFQPRPPLPQAPRRALILSNQISAANVAWIISSACARFGIRLRMAGLAQGNPSRQPELLLPRYDLVFARGRSALEGLAVGAAVICCDVEGLGPMVRLDNFVPLREANFGIQVLTQPLTRQNLCREIAKYDPADAAGLSERIRRTAGLEDAVDQILAVYGLALDEWRALPSVEMSAEHSACMDYVKFLSETYRHPHRHLTDGKGLTGPPGKLPPRLRMWLIKARDKALLAFHDVTRGLQTCPCTPLPSEGRQVEALETAQLACVVMSLGNQPTLVQAVKSLLEQKVPAEIVVVNSGGGDPSQTLEAAGIRVHVINHQGRLLPGAARNEGILATSAPFVSFLAADCRAEAGWVEARLQQHIRGRATAVSSAVTNVFPDNLWSRISHILLFSRRMPRVPLDNVLHFGVSYDRRLFDRYGLFREDLRTGEDSEFNDRFTPFMPITWAPDVRCAHCHPTTLAGLFRDQFRRGDRMARTLRQITGRRHQVIVARNALTRIVSCVRTALTASEGRESRQVLQAALLMPPVAAAYAMGALTAGLRQKSLDANRRPPRIFALLTFHNEMRYLPDYFRNVPPQVDGIIALDDGSTDGSGAFVARQPSVLELITLPPLDPHVWDEPRNRRLLVGAALRHQVDWLMVVDADERLERDFRIRAEAEIERGQAQGLMAFQVKCRELWDQPDTYREDGVWGRKAPVRLFKARRDHAFDDRPLHGHWAPLNSQSHGGYPLADLIFYHLSMLSPEDRQARRAKYLRLDPERKYQAIGYDYMTDIKDLRLAKLPPGREYQPFFSDSSINESERAETASEAEKTACSGG
ncbi:MAG: glycosyltransferase [Smithellaceae bacterium]